MNDENIIEVLKDIKKHPGCYFVGGRSFLLTAAFLSGYFTGRVDIGNFREWLVLKSDYRYNNAWWTQLVLLLAFPGKYVEYNLIPDEDIARNCLLDMTIEYLVERENRGENLIHQDYCELQKRCQEKYRDIER